MAFSFITAAAKHLSSVEIDGLISNQHEFNGVASLRRIFGSNRNEYIATFVYYDRNGSGIYDNGTVTWYDARFANPTRSAEYRLYYSDNNVVSRAAVNDLLVVGKQEDDSIVIIIVQNGSPYYNLCMGLFGLQHYTANYVISSNINIAV